VSHIFGRIQMYYRRHKSNNTTHNDC